MPDVEWVSKGADRVIKDFESVAKATEKNTNALKGTTKATEEMGRISQKIIKDNETAFQRYTREVTNAKIAADNNKISVQQMSKEHVRATVELLKETDAQDKNTAARNRSLAVRRQQSRLAEVFRLETLRGASFIKEETASIAAQTIQLGNYANKAQQVAGTWSQIAGMAGKLAPLMAVAAVTKQEEARSSAAGGRAIAASRSAGALMELAGGSKAKRDQLLGASRASFLEGGFAGGDESGAHALTFELESGGMLGEREFFSKAQRAGQNSATLAKNVAGLRAGFRGGDSVGSSEAILSKAAAAAAPATGAAMEDVLQGSTKAAQNAKQLGLSDEENFALVSKIAEVTGSGIIAGDRADALYRAFIRRKYIDKGKKPLVGLMAELGGKNLLPSALQEELGREEAAQAFSIASDIPALQKRIGEVRGAASSGLSTQIFDNALSIPSVQTATTVNQRDAAAQASGEAKGLRRQRIEAMIRDQEAEVNAAFPGAVAGTANALYGGYGSWIPGVTTLIPDALEDPGNRDLNAPNAMDEMARLLQEANRQRAQQQRRQAGAPNGRAE